MRKTRGVERAVDGAVHRHARGGLDDAAGPSGRMEHEVGEEGARRADVGGCGSFVTAMPVGRRPRRPACSACHFDGRAFLLQLVDGAWL